jgi:hypothetical protein
MPSTRSRCAGILLTLAEIIQKMSMNTFMDRARSEINCYSLGAEEIYRAST